MFEYMDRWMGGMGRQQKETIIQRLTKVRLRLCGEQYTD